MQRNHSICTVECGRVVPEYLHDPNVAARILRERAELPYQILNSGNSLSAAAGNERPTCLF
jgi:hypothetical protein